MRSLTIAVAMLLFLATSVFTVAENLFVNIVASGSLDAMFHGLTISATITGNVGLSGDISYGESTVWFSAEGSACGVGFRDILELTSEGWIVLSATGQTTDGEPIVIRTLLYALRQSLIPLKADDLFEGVHHTVIQIGDSAAVYGGEFSGTLVGGLAPAETEGTIRLDGSGNFCLSGRRVPEARSGDLPGTIPLNDPNLTETFLQIIAALFDLPIAQETPSVGNDP